MMYDLPMLTMLCASFAAPRVPRCTAAPSLAAAALPVANAHAFSPLEIRRHDGQQPLHERARSPGVLITLVFQFAADRDVLVRTGNSKLTGLVVGGDGGGGGVEAAVAEASGCAGSCRAVHG
jgi:hypothetical protein